MDIRTAEKLENFYTRVYSALERRFAAVRDNVLADAMNYVGASIEQQGETSDVYTIVRQATLAVALGSVMDDMQRNNIDLPTAIINMSSVVGIANTLEDAAKVNQTLLQKLGKQTIVDVVVPAIKQVALEWQQLIQETIPYIEAGQEVEGLLPQGNL
jgi:hypothetical protein